jgi:hypothetical protein
LFAAPPQWVVTLPPHPPTAFVDSLWLRNAALARSILSIVFFYFFLTFNERAFGREDHHRQSVKECAHHAGK